MSDVAGELSVIFSGRDVNLRALMQAVRADLRLVDTEFARAGSRLATGIGGGAQRAAGPLQALSAAERVAAREAAELARAQADAATSGQRLVTEQQRTAAATQRVATEYQRTAAATQQVAAAEQRVQRETASTAAAQDRAALAALRLQQARERAARAAQPSQAAQAAQRPSALSQLGTNFVGGLTSIVAPAAAATVAIQTLQNVVQSFGDAFVFKATLDANREAITAQLGAVRDTGPVFAEAASFGERYRFTQEEMTASIQASIPVLKQSNSSTTEVLSTLARLGATNPTEGIKGAAFALAELGSGDVQSLVERFRISRDAAYEMRDAIRAGADPVQVMARYLDQAGVGMGVLDNRTRGAMGALNELKVAQEEMALAQAEWAQGPGLLILQTQISATRGATRLLSGDFATIGQVVGANTSFFSTFAAELARTGDVALATAAADRALAEGLGLAAQGSEQAAQAGGTATGAWQTQEEAARAAAAAVTDAAAKELSAATDTETLSVAKEQLAAQAQAAAQAVVSGGGNIAATAARLAASSSSVDVLTAAYIRLFAAQQAAGIAGAQRLADQAAQTRNLVDPAALLGGPGQRGTGDVDAAIKGMEQLKKEQQGAADAARDQEFALADQTGQLRLLKSELEQLTPGTEAYIRKETELLQLQERAAAAGGRGRAGTAEKEQKQLLKAQQDYQDKSLSAAEQYEKDRAKIEEDGAKKRAAAERAFQLSQRESRAGFYAQLGNIKDQKLAQQLSAEYERAAQEAQEIARTQGADVAQEYLRAQQQAVQDQAAIQQDIAEAEKNKDGPRAEYLRGILKLQQDADAERLKQIVEGGSQIAAEEARQYADAQQRYAEHLDKIGETYTKKTQQLPGLATTLGAGAPPAGNTVPAPPPSSDVGAQTSAPGGPTQVIDVNAQQALDSGIARLEGKLDGIVAGVAAVERRVGAVESAIGRRGNSSIAP